MLQVKIMALVVYEQLPAQQPQRGHEIADCKSFVEALVKYYDNY
jgi:hypothetical protein